LLLVWKQQGCTFMLTCGSIIIARLFLFNPFATDNKDMFNKDTASSVLLGNLQPGSIYEAKSWRWKQRIKIKSVPLKM
jgi:hypothetical protein